MLRPTALQLSTPHGGILPLFLHTSDFATDRLASHPDFRIDGVLSAPFRDSLIINADKYNSDEFFRDAMAHITIHPTSVSDIPTIAWCLVLLVPLNDSCVSVSPGQQAHGVCRAILDEVQVSIVSCKQPAFGHLTAVLSQTHHYPRYRRSHKFMAQMQRRARSCPVADSCSSVLVIPRQSAQSGLYAIQGFGH